MKRPSDTHRRGEHPLTFVRDGRRRDPDTSLEPARQGGAAFGAADALRAQLRERTADLRRVTSEYDSYR